MAFSLGDKVNQIASWVCGSPTIYGAFRNVFIVALILMSIVAIILLFALSNKMTKKRVLTFSLYFFMASLVILFIHYYATNKFIEVSAEKRRVRETMAKIYSNPEGEKYPVNPIPVGENYEEEPDQRLGGGNQNQSMTLPAGRRGSGVVGQSPTVVATGRRASGVVGQSPTVVTGSAEGRPQGDILPAEFAKIQFPPPDEDLNFGGVRPAQPARSAPPDQRGFVAGIPPLGGALRLPFET